MGELVVLYNSIHSSAGLAFVPIQAISLNTTSPAGARVGVGDGVEVAVSVGVGVNVWVAVGV